MEETACTIASCEQSTVAFAHRARFLAYYHPSEVELLAERRIFGAQGILCYNAGNANCPSKHRMSKVERRLSSWER